jgi:hypothetical protein
MIALILFEANSKAYAINHKQPLPQGVKGDAPKAGALGKIVATVSIPSCMSNIKNQKYAL